MFFNSDTNRDKSQLARYWQKQQRGRAGQIYVPDAIRHICYTLRSLSEACCR